VLFAFYFSLFAVPFDLLILPGVSDGSLVARVVDLFLLIAVVTQPRVCLRRMPAAYAAFIGYALLRLAWGVLLTPELFGIWAPATRMFLRIILWSWFCYNLLQYPGTGRRGLWAFALGCTLCACFHVLHIGTAEVGTEIDNRLTLFGENANNVAVTYAVALVALAGAEMTGRRPSAWARPVALCMLGLIGAGLVLTASRGGALMASVGLLILAIPLGPILVAARRRSLLLLVVLVVGIAIARNPVVVHRLEGGLASTGKLELRARMYPILWEMYQRSPVYGSGPDGYMFEMTKRVRPTFARRGMWLPAHNLILLMLVETGALGLAIFLYGIAAALKAAWRARTTQWELVPLALLVSVMVFSTFTGAPHYRKAFWLVVTYALAGGGREVALVAGRARRTDPAVPLYPEPETAHA
jgi:hypothetical protein